MHIQPFIKRFALLVEILALGTICFSQHRTLVGLNIIGESASLKKFSVGFGGTFERQFTKHHGFETGLYYRNSEVQSSIFVDGSLYGRFYTRENYLSLPVLYKFYSTVVNISLGPTFDVFTGWKRLNKGLPSSPNTYAVYHKFQVGLMGKISKTIGLTDRIVLEPEIRYNRVFIYRKPFYGFGVSCKYRVSK